MQSVWADRFSYAGLTFLSAAIFMSVSLLSLYQLLILLAFLILLLSKQISFKELPKSSWALLVYVLVMLLSGILSFSELENSGHSLGSAKYPFVALISIFPLKKLIMNPEFKNRLRWVWGVFLFTIIFAAVNGILQVFWHYDLKMQEVVEWADRASGFTDIMRYGYGTAPALLVLIGLYLGKRNNIYLVSSKFVLAAIIFGFVGLYLSYTRGAMLGFLVGLPVLVYFVNKKVAKVVAFSSLGLCAILVVIALMGGSNKSRFFLAANNNSNEVRYSQYQSAWKGFTEKPVLGLGPQQLRYHVARIKNQYDLPHKEYVGQHAHNVFLEVLADTGILGFMTFMLWLCLWGWELIKSTQITKQLFLPILCFIFIAGQFEMIFVAQNETLIFFFYSLTCVSFLLSKESPNPL